MPVEPPPTRWVLPDPPARSEGGVAGGDDLIAVGGDLEPGTVLDAYRRGLFPMRADGMLAWWSPDPRGVIPLDGFHVSRTLRAAIGRFEIRVDTMFEAVMRACADPHRPHGWIDESFVVAYTRLHELGWAHSVETWQDGELVGGLYGLRIGGPVRGGVDVPSCDRRVEGGVLGDRRAAPPRRRVPVRRAVDDAAPAIARRGRRVPRRVPAQPRGRARRDSVSHMSADITVFHNQACSKSRGALEILEERGVTYDVVRYLDTPPDRATIERILDAIPDEPRALVRTDDDKFKKLGIPKADVTTREQVIDLLVAHPEVMQRPVVFVGDRAVIARPSEKVLELLD